MRDMLEREREGEDVRRREEPAAPLPPEALLAQQLGNRRFGAILGRSERPIVARGGRENPRDAEISRALASAASTRNPTGAMDDEIVTADPTGTAGGGGSATATPAPNGNVSSGPSYTPSGTIAATIAGARKRATFDFGATMLTDAAKGTVPRCCSIRQYIKWDKDFADWRGGPPHRGFPSGTGHDTWIEDRDQNDKRYGHRSGPHSDPIAGGGDEYLLAGVRDQANGDVYKGRDSPGGPTAMKGKFEFQLKAIDTCNGDVERAASSVITINW
jgi:hypothetical protein